MKFSKFRNRFYIKKYLYSDILPVQYEANLTKLMKKLQQADIGQNFKTSFDKKKKIFTFARLDYNRAGIILDRKFDTTDELILNAIYSIGREYVKEDDGSGEYQGSWQPVFTARKILQHIFGNIADHFQKEIVEIIEQHIEDMSYMKLTLDLKDSLGNDAYVTVNGEKYHPVFEFKIQYVRQTIWRVQVESKISAFRLRRKIKTNSIVVGGLYGSSLQEDDSKCDYQTLFTFKDCTGQK